MEGDHEIGSHRVIPVDSWERHWQMPTGTSDRGAAWGVKNNGDQTPDISNINDNWDLIPVLPVIRFTPNVQISEEVAAAADYFK